MSLLYFFTNWIFLIRSKIFTNSYTIKLRNGGVRRRVLGVLPSTTPLSYDFVLVKALEQNVTLRSEVGN